MPAIKVTSEQLESVSRLLDNGRQDVAQQLASMEAQVKGLVDADWQGAASSSFRDMWDKWHMGARQVEEALEGIGQLLQQAATTYRETEDQLSSQMRG
jgi:WXG100 family type VII secretion target